VTRLLKRALGSTVPLAVLPLGTANNVATAMGHVGVLEDLVRGWATAETRTFDLGRAAAAWGRTFFGESFGIGFLAETIARTDRKGANRARAKFDSVSARMGAMLEVLRKTLDSLSPFELTIETEAGTVTDSFLWAEASTVGLVGPRLPLVDADDQSDGLFAFASLPADERDTFVDYIENRIGGSTPARTGLVSDRLARVGLRWRDSEVHLDGRLISHVFTEADRQVELSAVASALRVLKYVRPS
jgi:diacylglycerol kinase family enzyme